MATAAEALTPFGFTALESEIYAFLLQESPATGYRIAQAINKPAANTYKAIQTLEAKGAVLTDDGNTKQCRAVAYEELLARLQKDFEKQKNQAQTLFATYATPTEDARLYALKSTEQAVQRAQQMIAEAEHSILLSADAATLDLLHKELQVASLAGMKVEILTNDNPILDAADIQKPITKPTKGELALVADANQLLIADLEGQEAYWTRSPFLTALHHKSLVAQRALAQLDRQLKDDEKKSRMMRTLDQAKEDLT